MTVQRRLYQRAPSITRVRIIQRRMKAVLRAFDELEKAPKLGQDDRLVVRRLRDEQEWLGERLEMNLVKRYQRDGKKGCK